MENSAEKKNQAPAIWVGSKLAGFDLGLPCFPPDQEIEFDINNLYLILYAEEEELAPLLDRLVQQGAAKDQIILAVKGGLLPAFAHDPLIGILEIMPEDTAEELRKRLNARIETQKHRKLAAEIELARQMGIPSGLTGVEWCLRMDAAHLVHAFSCALSLTAGQHGECLKLALQSTNPDSPDPWQKDTPLAVLLCHSARMALAYWQAPSDFREELRQKSSALPFRLRTDLRNTVERCMESVWKGVGHAA